MSLYLTLVLLAALAPEETAAEKAAAAEKPAVTANPEAAEKPAPAEEAEAATNPAPASVVAPSVVAPSVDAPSVDAPSPATETKIDWSFNLSAYIYIVPDDSDYAQPTFTADRDWLHLEARYNYEDLETGSAWFGYNFSLGEELALELTPMVGGAFGNTNGIAVGYKGSLNWWKLELYSEGEYLFDLGDLDDSFFYTWSELTLAPVDWCRFGLAIQRTKVYESDFDIQRGFVLGFSYKEADLSGYLFNPDASPPTVVVAVSLGF